MGLAGSPFTFSRLITTVLSGLSPQIALAYLDDLISSSSLCYDTHLARLGIVFNRLKDAGLRLKPSKLQIAKTRVDYLGFILENGTVRPSDEKIRAVRDYGAPSDLRSLRAFLGLTNYFRDFIPEYSNKALPLTRLLKKNVDFSWGPVEQTAFETLKNALTSDSVLVLPDPNREFVLHCDSSGFAIASCLVQVVDGKERPVAYASRKLNQAEMNYSTTEKEMLSCIFAIKTWRYLLCGHPLPFKIVSDHAALRFLGPGANLGRDPHGRLARWVLALSEYRYSVHFKPGKLNVVPDALSRDPRFTEQICSIQSTDVKGYQPIWDSQLLYDEQRRDEKLQTEILSLESGNTSQNFALGERGILYHIDESGRRTIAAPRSMRWRVMEAYHASRFFAHVGMHRTYDLIRRSFWWPSLKSEVFNYVRSCCVSEN